MSFFYSNKEQKIIFHWSIWLVHPIHTQLCNYILFERVYTKTNKQTNTNRMEIDLTDSSSRMLRRIMRHIYSSILYDLALDYFSGFWSKLASRTTSKELENCPDSQTVSNRTSLKPTFSEHLDTEQQMLLLTCLTSFLISVEYPKRYPIPQSSRKQSKEQCPIPLDWVWMVLWAMDVSCHLGEGN